MQSCNFNLRCKFIFELVFDQLQTYYLENKIMKSYIKRATSASVKEREQTIQQDIDNTCNGFNLIFLVI